MEIITDAFVGGQGFGSVAEKLLANNCDPNALRNNTVLLTDEWKVFDRAVLKAQESRLNAVADLMTRGLVMPTGTGLAQTVFESQKSSDMADAEVSMDGETRGRNDRITFGIDNLPLPIIHKDFDLSVRTLNMSRRYGQPLDVSQAEIAGRKNAETQEEMLMNGYAYQFNASTIYGYTNHPSRNLYDITDWNGSAFTPEIGLTQILGMKQMALDDDHLGPFVLYLPTDYETVIGEDYKSASDKAFRTRLLEIDQLVEIKVSSKLADNNIVLVEMQSETARMIEAQPLVTVQWETQGGMKTNFKVLAINIPQVRANKDGKMGLVHGGIGIA